MSCEVRFGMKLKICESNYPQELKDAIFAYTAQGGNLASKYPFDIYKTEILKNALYSNKIKLDCNIYRGIWMSEKQWEKVFYNWYEEKHEPFKMYVFNSFTKDEGRAHGYGNGGDVFVLLVLEKGTTIHALELWEDSMYPEEEEVLVANDTFYIKNIQFSEHSGYSTIVYLTNKRV